MITRTKVSLNDVLFTDIDERIVIQHIEESPLERKLNAVSRGNGSGQYVTAFSTAGLQLTITFAIAEHVNYAERLEIFEKIVRFASQGGWLRVNYRENQKIFVRCAKLPGRGQMYEWNKDYDIVFIAYESPYWQENDTTTVTMKRASTEGTQSLNVGGNMPAKLSFSVTNPNSVAENTLSISCGKYSMRFENLELETGERFELSYDQQDRQQIVIYDTDGAPRSAYHCRTLTSSDDILMEGDSNNTVRFGSPRSMLWSFSYAGRWI